jgi:hypothetical protein
MMTAIRTFLVTLGVLVATHSIAGPKTVYAPNGEEQFVGRAIDWTTGEPLAGVWVAASYVLGSGGLHGSAGCTIGESVRSDEKGEYVLPYHNGLPPQFLTAFGHRYQRVAPARQANRDTSERWIVNVLEPDGQGKRRIVRQEGPFVTMAHALKASRMNQDVWLEKFPGTDDEWVNKLSTFGNPIHACASRLTAGELPFEEALLAEIQSMPESSARSRAIEHSRGRVERTRGGCPNEQSRRHGLDDVRASCHASL